MGVEERQQAQDKMHAGNTHFFNAPSVKDNSGLMGFYLIEINIKLKGSSVELPEELILQTDFDVTIAALFCYHAPQKYILFCGN